jgi:hypothetical protein
VPEPLGDDGQRDAAKVHGGAAAMTSIVQSDWFHAHVDRAVVQVGVPQKGSRGP